MKTIFNKIFICFALISAIGFTNCADTNDDVALALTIEEKVALLEGSEWLLKGFETTVKYAFVDGQRHTFYADETGFSDTPIPGSLDYKISNEMLTIDFNFGNVSTYELEFSCNNNIVKFLIAGELNMTLYKIDSDYKECL